MSIFTHEPRAGRGTYIHQFGSEDYELSTEHLEITVQCCNDEEKGELLIQLWQPIGAQIVVKIGAGGLRELSRRLIDAAHHLETFKVPE